MWNLIDKLRALPENSRKTVSVFLAVIFTLCIMVPWFYFQSRAAPNNEEDKSVTAVVTPFTLLAGEASDVGDKVNAGWKSAFSIFTQFQSANKESTSTTPKI